MLILFLLPSPPLPPPHTHTTHSGNRGMRVPSIPAHCNITGNEAVDRLAKEGGKLEQREEQKVTFDEVRTT